MTITDIIHRLKTGHYAKAIQLNAGASDKLIAEAEQALQIKLPDDFKQFYRFANGVGSSNVNDSLFYLVSLEDMVDYNERYEQIPIAEYLVYSDIWELLVDRDNHNHYRIFSSQHPLTIIELTNSFAEFLDRFLTTGLDGVFNWENDTEVHQIKSSPDAWVAQLEVTHVSRIKGCGIALTGKILKGNINANNVICVELEGYSTAVRIESIEDVRIHEDPFQIGLVLSYKESDEDDAYFKKLEGQKIDIFQ